MKKIIISEKQYKRIFAKKKINESMDKIDNTFKKEFSKHDISTLTNSDISEETNFDIKKPNTSLPRNFQIFGRPIMENDEDFLNECMGLIKYMYGNDDNFSPYWEENNLTYEDICENLLEKNMIIKKEGNYSISKNLGDPKEAKNAVIKELCEMVNKNINEYDNDNYPLGADADPDAPWNQKPEIERKRIPTDFKVIDRNLEFALLDKDGVIYIFDYFQYRDNIKKFFGEDDITDEMLEDYLQSVHVKEGDGLRDWEAYDLVKLDEPLKQEILNVYENTPFGEKLKNISINEEINYDDVKSKMKDFGKHFTPTERPEKSPEEKQRILDKLKAIRDKELASREKEDDNLDEVTGAASSGAYTAAFSGGPISREMPDDVNKLKVPVVYESTDGSDAVGQYTAPAFKMKKNHTDFDKTKPKAFKKTQWAKGGFVKFDDCTKLNNNKKAQNGGCSAGAVDNVVKVVTTKDNVNAPSLNEAIIHEALKLQYDKKENMLIVISDLEGRAGNQETFRNRAVLKQSGFEYSGTNWYIPADKLDVAKKTLSLINKADYIIEKLEDLELAVEGSNADNKTLLKARLDQYINDLANATDEAALSAEIRRYLTFFSKFHGYSFYNRILIFIQKPDATKVASFNLWKSKHRIVKKGAKAIKILAPAGKPEKIEYDADTEELMGQLGMKNEPQVTRFKAVNVFDISDTEPIDERGEAPDTPQWWGENTPSETADMLYEALVEVAEDLGIKVTKGDAKRGEKGFSAGDHINISSDVSGAGRLSVMVHEITHELMHWKKTSIYYIDNGQGKESYALGELQAESVSYVVLKHYGIPASHHATYLALWKANKEKIQNNLEIISKVAQFIIDKIDKQILEDK